MGGLLLIAALVGFLIRRKTKRNRISARDDDDDEVYGIGRRNSGRGEKYVRFFLALCAEVEGGERVLESELTSLVLYFAFSRRIERKRLDLAEEDLSPGRLEPFTVRPSSC